MNELINEKVLKFLMDQANVIEPAAVAVDNAKEEEET
jgi:hypothetical protein